MATKTYSEQQQAILFKAARDLRAVAGQVLDDFVNPVELTSSTTLGWGKEHARKIAERANRLENEGHELAVASAQSEANLLKSKERYSRSIDAFERRIKAAGGTVPVKTPA